MEGNLYHLIKARKGRPLAGGLVASIFFQIVSGLDHIHTNGYFHRDMKPENVLVTTTGLFDYTPLSPVAPPNTTEKDVVAIIKLADFGLARETRSLPPYTEYVSTRWYRAPEVLLLSRDYSNPVDMWALGTIMAELVNLRPLFPGSDQVDQIARICQVLGNPSNDYGVDSFGAPLGGGAWLRGLQMAQQVGFEFRPVSNPNFISAMIVNSSLRCLRRIFTHSLTVLYPLRLSTAYATSSSLIPTSVLPVISVFIIVTSLNLFRSTISPYHLASAWPHPNTLSRCIQATAFHHPALNLPDPYPHHIPTPHSCRSPQ